MPINNISKFLVSVAFVLSAIAFVVLPSKNEIVSPRLTAPVILLPASEFIITLRHSVPLNFDNWRVRLQLKSIAIEKPSAIDLSVVDTELGFATSSITVKLPSSIANGNYSLSIVSQDGAEDGARLIRENAVHIRQQFSDNISIIQLADLPTLGGDGKGDKMLAGIIDEINIINPDVVLFSGDLAYGGSWDQYERLVTLLTEIQAPVIAAPGNHAYYGWGGYLKLLGKPYHQVEMGNYQFISLNSGHGRDQLTLSQINWFENIVQKSTAKYRVVQLHHPVQHRADLRGYLRANRAPFLKIIKESGVAIVLSGHWHGDSVYDINGNERVTDADIIGPPFVVTTTAGADFRADYSSSELHYGYRLIRFVDGILDNYTYDYDGDGVRDAASSIPIGKIKVIPRGRYGVMAINQLNEGFLSARVNIRIPDGTSDFSPNRGKTVALQRLDGESIYTIEILLPANREVAISMNLEGFND